MEGFDFVPGGGCDGIECLLELALFVAHRVARVVHRAVAGSVGGAGSEDGALEIGQSVWCF